jgi:DUF1680 family protein
MKEFTWLHGIPWRHLIPRHHRLSFWLPRGLRRIPFQIRIDSVKRNTFKPQTIIGLILSAISATAFAGDYPLRSASVGKVKITGGFWGPRVTSIAKVTVPHNFKYYESTGRLPSFDQAAGINSGKLEGEALAGESDVFKNIEGAAYSLQLRPAEIDGKDLARQVARVIAAQEDNGFLCPRFSIGNRESRWDDLRKSHVLFSAGHLFEAGVTYQDATGESNLLKASARFADLIDSRFGHDKVRDVPGHQEIELALIKLYQATGEKRYLNLCKFFLDQRGHPHARDQSGKTRSDDYNQDRVPLADAEHAVGHAVRAFYTYAAMTDIAALCDDKKYRDALDKLWQDIVGQKLYITGGSATAQYYDEGFGDPYQLPNDTAYCETCGTIASALWCHRMALLHADSVYVDVLERALYNGVLSGISLSGDKFFYTNPLASRGSVRRQSNWDPSCCQSNLVRIIPQVGAMAYATDASTAFVNLFVNGMATLDLEKGPLTLRMETAYPHDGKIRITVVSGPEEPITIALRIPGWAREQPVPGDLYHFAATNGEKTTLEVDGRPFLLDKGTSIRNGYVRIERAWKAGTVVELDLPMPVRRVLAHDKVEANRGRVALQRGPLVYCVEAIDNGGLRTDAIVLPDTTSFKTELRKDLLGEVVTITGTSEIAIEPKTGEPAQSRPHPIVAIPYYSWANRTDGYMDIWLARTIKAARPLSAPTAGAVAKVSASTNRPAGELLALNDRREGPSSRFRPTPRFTSPAPSKGEGENWIQYEWDAPRELSQTSVYWARDEPKKVYWGERVRGTLLKMPKAWQLLYKDGDAWQPVLTDNDFALNPDQSNKVHFTPVKTTAVRLSIDPSDAPSGIQEWLVD